MKKSLLIIALLGTALAACVKQELPTAPAPEPAPGTVPLADAYGAEIRTVKMDDRTTCYIVTRQGDNAISCVQR